MSKVVKSGNEMLNQFFSSLHSIAGVDEEIADVLIELYRGGTFTSKAVSNALLSLREEAQNDKD